MFRRSDFGNRQNNNETPRRDQSPSSTFDQHGRIAHNRFRIDQETSALCVALKPRSFQADGSSLSSVKKLQPVVEKSTREIDFLPSCDESDIKVPPLNFMGQRRRNTDEDSVTKPDQPKRWHRTIVDIMPGFRAPLVGVRESLEAYRADRCFHTTCTECSTFLYCIITAHLVLCPQCKAISPTSKHIPTLQEESTTLGLGLTVEHLLADPDCQDDYF